ncbi:putative ribosomal protein L14P [Lupinus albus]|uniref:Putative ribosomal protein L14P n=1 Tax=Lupinus albus TaxID=3870 RepID=A0A6A4N794_LUPAL|nr:putative ribosomal protein L14P [Lupinus albus]
MEYMYVTKIIDYKIFLPFLFFATGLCSCIAGSAITGPIGKECADLWPRIASAANAIV